MPRRRLAPAAVAGASAAVLLGCHGSGSPPIAAAPAPPSAIPAPLSTPAPFSTTVGPWHGRLAGFGDGVLTADGELRITVLDPTSQTPTQLVAHVTTDGPFGVGTGVVVGQDCSRAEPNRFCQAGPASAAIQMAAEQRQGGGVGITSEVRVTTDARVETWTFEMGHWGGVPPGWAYEEGGGVYRVAGLYRPTAEFIDAETVVSVDHAGRVFFQSVGTGCVGNGTVSLHAAQANENVYDLRLTLENCTGDAAAWNGVLEGLATLEPINPWDYSLIYGVRFWLSAVEGAPIRATAGEWWPL